jgi:hypothetical protein
MSAGRAFYCPMHSDVHAVDGGKCPHCHLDLVAAGTPFALVKHMLGNPLHIVLMVAAMIAVMALAMILMR